jgi:hypothetical protein
MNEKMREVMRVGGDMKEAMARDVANHMRAVLENIVHRPVVDSTPIGVSMNDDIEARKIDLRNEMLAEAWKRRFPNDVEPTHEELEAFFSGLVKVASPGGNRRQRRERN